MTPSSFTDPIIPAEEQISDQIRGVAMALRHWFVVEDLEAAQRRAGLLPEKQGKRTSHDRTLQVLAISALPPQLVRLKPDSPITTLHFMQDVYDDGVMRADPWRWWFAWIAIELISRTGPDTQGEKTSRFIREDPSLELVRATAPRWLAANPTRMLFVETRQRTLLERALDRTLAADATVGGRTLDERVMATGEYMIHGIVDAMTDEARAVAKAITMRLRERAERIR
jgi:hypothetical protein